jgi:hypothetical protein
MSSITASCSSLTPQVFRHIDGQMLDYYTVNIMPLAFASISEIIVLAGNRFSVYCTVNLYIRIAAVP